MISEVLGYGVHSFSLPSESLRKDRVVKSMTKLNEYTRRIASAILVILNLNYSKEIFESISSMLLFMLIISSLYVYHT